MNLRVNRQELADALAVVGAVAATRTPKPILQCVLLEALGDHLLLMATDLEIGVRFVVTQVEVSDKGAVLVSADKFGQIVRESTDEILALETKERALVVRGVDSHFQIVSQDPKEFPPVAQMEGEADFEIAASLLRSMAEWTVFAAARENTRYAINGVLWELEKGRLNMVATDGRRLSFATGEVTAKPGASARAIVPVKAIQLHQRLLADSDDSVRVKVLPNQLIVRTQRATLGSALVEGHFPKYQDVIPTDGNKTAQLSTAEFLSAVRRVALLTNEESRGIKLSLSGEKLTLSSRAPEQGEAEVTIPVQFRGDPIDIGFNPNFLVDALRAVRGDEVTLDLKESNRPGVMRVGSQQLYVVMPLNLS